MMISNDMVFKSFDAEYLAEQKGGELIVAQSMMMFQILVINTKPYEFLDWKTLDGLFKNTLWRGTAFFKNENNLGSLFNIQEVGTKYGLNLKL